MSGCNRLTRPNRVPGVRLIVLSEHVDYWNHDGWKDPFSSAFISDRQSDYVRALGLKSPYTPQVIVDGSSDLRISDAQQVEQTFQKAATIPKLPIRILAATRDPKNSDMVRVQVEVQGNSINPQRRSLRGRRSRSCGVASLAR